MSAGMQEALVPLYKAIPASAAILDCRLCFHSLPLRVLNAQHAVSKQPPLKAWQKEQPPLAAHLAAEPHSTRLLSILRSKGNRSKKILLSLPRCPVADSKCCSCLKPFLFAFCPAARQLQQPRARHRGAASMCMCTQCAARMHAAPQLPETEAAGNSLPWVSKMWGIRLHGKHAAWPAAVTHPNRSGMNSTTGTAVCFPTAKGNAPEVLQACMGPGMHAAPRTVATAVRQLWLVQPAASRFCTSHCLAATRVSSPRNRPQSGQLTGWQGPTARLGCLERQ